MCRKVLVTRHQGSINDQYQYPQNHHMIVGLVAAEPCETSSIGDRRHKGRLSEGRWVPCSDQQCCMITIMMIIIVIIMLIIIIVIIQITIIIIIIGDTKGGNRRVVVSPALTKNMFYDHDDNDNGDDHHNHHHRRHKGQLLEGRWAPANGSASTKGDICLAERKSTRIRRMAF